MKSPNTGGRRGSIRPSPSIANTNYSKNSNYLHIGTYNIRSLVAADRQNQLEHSLEHINWDIIGLSEVKKEGTHIIEKDKYILMYTGDKGGKNGIGFIIKKYLQKNIINFTPISDRVARLDILIERQEISLIQVYAPTLKAKDSDIDLFYNNILQALDNTSTCTFVMGDFNAKIGQPTSDDIKVMGNWGYGNRNIRGEILIQFCLENQLKITNTFFKKNLRKKWTWRSPDEKYANEIDFILTKNINNLNNIEVITPPYPTDHRLVRATLNVTHKLKKSRQNFSHTNKELTLTEKEHLKNKFINITKNDLYNKNIQKTYNEIIDNIKKCQSSLPQKHIEENIITEEIKELIIERTKLKSRENKTSEEKSRLTHLYRTIKRKILKNNKQQKYKIIEQNLEQNRSVKRSQKQLNKDKYWVTSLRDNHNNIVTNRKDIIDTATSYYKNLYRSNDNIGSQHNIENNITNEDLPPFITAELTQALLSLKTAKSPGEDGITNDILKAIADPLTPLLLNLFNEILIQKTIPLEWEKTVVTLLYKKGDPKNIGNYRPISLLQGLYKVFTGMLLKRLRIILDFNQPIEQAGFRPKFSTMDHIFTISQIIERYNEYGKTLYIAFIDYSKAFDSISHKALWAALESQGIQHGYITLLQNIYNNSKARIKMDRLGKEFNIEKGVRQGDPISPNLFTAILERIFSKLNWDNLGININGEYLNHLRFADDIIIISESHEQLEYMLRTLDEESRECGLHMNPEKTCLMTNGEKIPLCIHRHTLNYVEEYTYLGQNITFIDHTLKEIDTRIKKAWNKYWSLKHIFKSNIPLKLKKIAMDTAVLPTLLYGCQSWALTRKIIYKLQVFQRATERSMMNIKLRDRQRNKDIRNKTKLIDAAILACKLKWRWAGHVARATDGRWSERVLHWYPRESTRPRGRPHRRWRDDVVDVAGAAWCRQAADRRAWQQMEEAYTRRWVPTLDS